MYLDNIMMWVDSENIICVHVTELKAVSSENFIFYTMHSGVFPNSIWWSVAMATVTNVTPSSFGSIFVVGFFWGGAVGAEELQAWRALASNHCRKFKTSAKRHILYLFEDVSACGTRNTEHSEMIPRNRRAHPTSCGSCCMQRCCVFFMIFLIVSLCITVVVLVLLFVFLSKPSDTTNYNGHSLGQIASERKGWSCFNVGKSG